MAETGWSIGEIARRADVSSSAVSQWLNGQTASIRIEPAIKLQQGSGFNALWLAKGKGPKKAGAATDVEPEFAGTMNKIRRVPVVGTARMGENGYYEEISAVVGAGDGHIEIAVDDPNAYGLRVRGQSMFPAIRDGWYVLIKPNGIPHEGEYVLLKFNDGRKMVKELLFRRKDSIEVMSVNGGERMTFELSELEGMQPVGAVVSPSQWRPD
ncbi:Phage repressor protein C, contains Cro/C1-type HTH and peptisase s24 domains [Variovorax sp. NFACC28]|nr:Phage repressor protein C, contains Cro/C1-type HTH and peptisase s24 domains [Variovorax sp. NFACC28]SEF72461.1 Phage repressor protein C, contains Cro/C1-type HTH and peptisase s24 domains [Variovorax sp. NFACC29]SFB77229.1 Phage repressor protein C, contains Cro/C1-type HTH and peptisase s24 domains [Variovorax sp. NFACC26]SFG76852.1 Phage repressor protein C, contains Cro/C1-type HTH and peptisase s24 domains [Variovorax sp. NFACC27]